MTSSDNGTGVKITQSKLTFAISLVSLLALAYAYSEDRARTRFQVETLQKDQVELQQEQVDLEKDMDADRAQFAAEIKALRATLNGRVTDLVAELNEMNLNLRELQVRGDK